VREIFPSAISLPFQVIFPGLPFTPILSFWRGARLPVINKLFRLVLRDLGLSTVTARQTHQRWVPHNKYFILFAKRSNVRGSWFVPLSQVDFFFLRPLVLLFFDYTPQQGIGGRNPAPPLLFLTAFPGLVPSVFPF